MVALVDIAEPGDNLGGDRLFLVDPVARERALGGRVHHLQRTIGEDIADQFNLLEVDRLLAEIVEVEDDFAALEPTILDEYGRWCGDEVKVDLLSGQGTFTEHNIIGGTAVRGTPLEHFHRLGARKGALVE